MGKRRKRMTMTKYAKKYALKRKALFGDTTATTTATTATTTATTEELPQQKVLETASSRKATTTKKANSE